MWCWAGKPASITHCSQLQRAGGAQGGFLSGTTGAGKWGEFFNLQFLQHHFSEGLVRLSLFPRGGEMLRGLYPLGELV